MKIKDLTNKKFGRLTAVRPTDKRDRSEVIWKCRCGCGGECFVRGSHLNTGNTKSCGCLRIKGPSHPNWSESRNDQERRRKSKKQVKWVADVRKRDNHTCQGCGTCEGAMNAHHLVHFRKHESKRLDISNGITLCNSCHKELHKKFGYNSSNVEEQMTFIKGCKRKESSKEKKTG